MENKILPWPLMKDCITEEDKQSLVDFIQTSNRYTNGPKVKEFEHRWSEWLGVRHSLFVSSGSTANFLLLSAIKRRYNLKKGDKVLVPAMTWVTNVAPIIQLGLKPIFCDVENDTFSFDLEHMVRLHQEHPDIRLVFVTHLFGIPAPIAACLAGACPIPAGKTQPITTSSISSGFILALLIAPFIAILPKSGAFSLDKLP